MRHSPTNPRFCIMITYLPKWRYVWLCVWFCLCLSMLPAYADVFRILDNDRESLQARADLIEQSEKEILLSYYIVNDDLVGKALFQLLINAAKERGVNVHIMIDALRSRISGNVLAYLKENNVAVQVFNPGRLFKPRTITHRLHDKIFLTDAQNLITGGRNLKRDYYQLGEDINFTDRDVLIQGEKAITTARNHFFNMWNNPHLSFTRKTPQLTPDIRQHIAAQLQNALDTLQKMGVIHLQTHKNWAAEVAPTASEVFFEHDDFFMPKGNKFVQTGIKDLRSTNALLHLINNAQHTVIIENAYVIPTSKMNRALKKALRRGVSIRILTNSAATNDVMIAQAAYLIKRKKLIRMGIDIWEYQGPNTLHTKAAVIDDTISVVSSYNLHAVSQKWTTEVLAWVADANISRLHTAMMNNNLKKSVNIGKNNKPTPQTRHKVVKASCSRLLRLYLARYTGVAYLMSVL